MNTHEFVPAGDGFCHVCGDHAAAHPGYVDPDDLIGQQAAVIERLRDFVGIVAAPLMVDGPNHSAVVHQARAVLDGRALTAKEMRFKMDDASLRMKRLFERVRDAQTPSLVELTERLKNVPEVSGTVRQPKVDTPESKEAS